MAKFKVGQKVKLKRSKQPVKIVKVYEIPRDFKKFIRDMGMGNDLKPSDFSENQYVVDPNDEGDWIGERELVANSFSSSNPVVQNALAAKGVARNGYGSQDGKRFYERFGNDVDVTITFNDNGTRSSEISVGGMKYKGSRQAKAELNDLKAKAKSLGDAIKWIESNYPDAK